MPTIFNLDDFGVPLAGTEDIFTIALCTVTPGQFISVDVNSSKFRVSLRMVPTTS